MAATAMGVGGDKDIRLLIHVGLPKRLGKELKVG